MKKFVIILISILLFSFSLLSKRYCKFGEMTELSLMKCIMKIERKKESGDHMTKMVDYLRLENLSAFSHFPF